MTVTSPRTRILVVEDDEVTQNLIKRFLERAGFEVSVADNGLDAIEIVREWVPQLVLLDMMMPRMDGFGFLRALKGSPAEGLPVIVTSALADPARQQHALSLGAKEYLVKTKFSLSELTEAIRRHVAA
jgi:CheY-like chemotaxis protein